MEFIREDCIYARQSVDRKDSISIESQIDFCKYELKGGSCRVFKDKGYSGKNTDRPEFQKLLGEIRKGKVRRVIVYKLDRISRSILDFATMMELFQEYDVEFVSSTEKFDTSTPMGRAMLNICIVFAQLERETIQKLSLIAQILVTANDQVPYFICTGCNFSTCTRLTAFCNLVNLVQHIKYLLGRMPTRFIFQRPLA